MLYSLFSINLTIRISVSPLAKHSCRVDLPWFVSDPKAAIIRLLALVENVRPFAGIPVTKAPRTLRTVQPIQVVTSFYGTHYRNVTQEGFLNLNLCTSLQSHRLSSIESSAALMTSLAKCERQPTLPQRERQPRISASGRPAKLTRGEPMIKIPSITNAKLFAKHTTTNKLHPSTGKHDRNLGEGITGIK